MLRYSEPDVTTQPDVDRLRLQTVGRSDPEIGSGETPEPAKDRIFAGRGPSRKELYCCSEEVAGALRENGTTVGFPESSDRASVPRRLNSRRLLVPVGVKLGLGRIGFHTFRHTYRAWLDETGAPMGVQQKLMRNAHISTTMDQYGNASALAKRKANQPIVQRVLRREMNQHVSIQ
jgi:hypothetical protein